MNKKKLIDLIEGAWIEILLINNDGQERTIKVTMNPLVAIDIHIGDKFAFNKREFKDSWLDFLHDNGHKINMDTYLQSMNDSLCFIQITGRIFHFGKCIELQAKVVPPDGVFYIGDYFP